MQTIYLDHAATSFPKAPGVADAMAHYLNDIGANIGRGQSSGATDAEWTVFALREKLGEAFGSPDASACILTPGATFGLNLVLKGCLRAGDHALVSAVEHNAVLRPLSQVPGITVEKVPCDPDGSLPLDALASRIRPNTRLVCLTHASNVCGTLLPIAQVGALCRELGIPFVVDAAQTAGHVPVNREGFSADALILPAHKGLLGPQGIGAALLAPQFAHALPSLVAGGTGSRSALETQPEELPDKFESGTLNLPGAYGFLAALTYGVPRRETLHAQAMERCGQLLEGVARLPGVRILGKQGIEGRVATVALDFATLDNAMVSDRLAKVYGIATRCGLHCAPSAHRTLGSYPQGAVRLSIGHGNTDADIHETLIALEDILTDRRRFASPSANG